MKTNRIPSIDECYSLMKNNNMLPNIFEHSVQVMNVALAITDNIKQGVVVNRQLVIAGSLLHDITKTNSLNTREPHDITGGQFARDAGFFDVAEVIEEHVVLKNFVSDGKLQEKEIVFYADKRVMHNQIVTIDERMEDLAVRYNRIPEIWRINFRRKTDEVEKKINSFLISDVETVISTITKN